MITIEPVHNPAELKPGSILSLPRYRNIKYPKDPTARLVSCPVCGEDCWENDDHRKLLQENPNIKAACTMCAIRAGIANR